MQGTQVCLLETLCHDCVIRLLYFPATQDDPWGRIDVELISNHRTLEQVRWPGRIKNAWAVLRNRYCWTGFDFNDEPEARGVPRGLLAGGAGDVAQGVS